MMIEVAAASRKVWVFVFSSGDLACMFGFSVFAARAARAFPKMRSIHLAMDARRAETVRDRCRVLELVTLSRRSSSVAPGSS